MWSFSAATISIGPRSGFFVSTLSSVHGLRFAFAAWKSTLPGPGTTSFVTPYTRGPARERFAADIFERFGLPDRLD